MNKETMPRLTKEAIAKTQPAQKLWVGLTDEEKTEIIEKYMTALGLGVMFIDEVEAKLKGKNT